MDSAAPTAERRLPTAHTRFTLVVCTMLAAGFVYVAATGQAGPGASAWLAGFVGLLLALHATLAWLEDTREGFRTSTIGRRLAALRLVALGIAFVGGIATLLVARAWPLAILLTLVGGAVTVILVPALSRRVFRGRDAIAGGVRRPGGRFKDASKVVTVGELEPGMQIVMGAGLRPLSPLSVESVVEDEGVVHVRTHVDADAFSVLSFTRTPDALVRVVRTQN